MLIIRNFSSILVYYSSFFSLKGALRIYHPHIRQYFPIENGSSSFVKEFHRWNHGRNCIQTQVQTLFPVPFEKNWKYLRTMRNHVWRSSDEHLWSVYPPRYTPLMHRSRTIEKQRERKTNGEKKRYMRKSWRCSRFFGSPPETRRHMQKPTTWLYSRVYDWQWLWRVGRIKTRADNEETGFLFVDSVHWHREKPPLVAFAAARKPDSLFSFRFGFETIDRPRPIIYRPSSNDSHFNLTPSPRGEVAHSKWQEREASRASPFLSVRDEDGSASEMFHESV